MPTNDASWPPRQPTAGAMLGPYRLDEQVGAGGMGVVFRAFDTRLNRAVAVKVIGIDAAAHEHSRDRFLREARAACTLNHPNVVTIHEVDTADGVDFIVMELVEGHSLARRLADGPLPIDEGLAAAEQIGSALEAAHAAGIVHRDVKPANVMLTPSGRVKVLDFGIAKRLAAVLPDAATMPATAATMPGHVLGSLPYMSPEQAQGMPVDDRSDVFSFGILLFELFTGRRPFGGATDVETLAKILEAPAPSLDAARHDVPAPLGVLVHACLEKDRTRRPSAGRVREQLTALRRSRTADLGSVWAALSRRTVVVPVAIVLALVATLAAARWASGRDERAARRRVPELVALADKFDFDGFYRAARDVMPLVPDDDHLRQVWLNMTSLATVFSEPSGAEVFIKGYNAPSAEWISLGHTPLTDVRVPVWLNRVRMVKAGHVAVEASLVPFGLTYVLPSEATAPPGMVRVPGGPADVESANVTLPAFWIDTHEVTNAEFKAFVDAGGYRRRDWWTEALNAGDRPVSWEAAMAAFVDRTGKPGPAMWELGTHPEGQKDFPVAGISWYEAAAYAAFAGKSLPTAFQWRAAAGLIGVPMPFSDILMFSNFGMKGPAEAGSHAGLGLWGTYDMAGNVKEWCWNEAAGGRMILGGAWNEPTYMFDDRDAQPALQRLPTYGMRLVKNVEPLPADARAFVRKTTRDYASERPVDDATFAVIRNLYRYDARPLNARTELSETTSDWRHERVSFDAAYGGERVTAHVYLPRDTPPPYQVIVFFPGGDAQLLSSSRELRLTESSYHVRSGRALVYPIYKGTYERRVQVTGINARRDLAVARVKDVQRALDYIASRPDLDATRIAYHGISLGSSVGVLALAVEPRFKAAILLAGGLGGRPPAEFDAFNFAPRITVPTLMVNGRADFSFPLETSQKPLFRAIGVSPEHKRHAVLEGGHLPPDIHAVIREMLAWLDRYLGPTEPVSTRH